MSTSRIFLLSILISLVTALAVVPLASAHRVNPHRATLIFRVIKQHKAKRTSTRPQSIRTGMGNTAMLGCVNLPSDVQFVRIIVGWTASVTGQLACAQHARAAGYPILLVVQWDNRWDLDAIKSRFTETLRDYSSVHPFAVAIGNEQELRVTGNAKTSPEAYANIWRHIEPMVAHAMPYATRVGGEISPWGDAWMAEAVKDGLPGVQALATHAYPAGSSNSPYLVSHFAQIARKIGAQAWADEGLCGPGAWTFYGCTTKSELQHDGYSLAAEWYAHTNDTPIPPTSTAPNGPTTSPIY